MTSPTPIVQAPGNAHLAETRLNRRHLAWAALIMVLGVALTVLIHQTMWANNTRAAQARFQEGARQFHDQLRDKLSHYGPGISATRALFNGADLRRVTLQNFHAFASQINLLEDFPAATGIGYAAWIQPQNAVAFERLAQQQGRPNFRIQRGEPHGGELLVVQYLEPEFDHAPSIGRDLASSPQQLWAAKRAIERNQPVLSELEAVDQSLKPGIWLTIFMPVYQSGAVLATSEQRRQASQGLVFLPLNLRELFEGLMLAYPGFQVQVEETASGKTIFSSDQIRPSSANLQPYTGRFSMYGAQWQLRIQADQSLDAWFRAEDIAITTAMLIAGSFLLAVALYLLLGNLSKRRQTSTLNARLAAIVESVEEAIVSQDLNGRITSWNQAAERLFGKKTSDVIGQPFLQAVAGQLDADADAAMLNLAQQGQNLAPVHWALRGEDGRHTPILMSVSVIVDEAGTLTGFARIVRDMQHQYQLEAELREAQKMHAIGQLTGGLAHDFNNLLGVVLGNLENALVRLPKGQETVRSDMQAAQVAALRGAEVVRSLLTVARPEPVALSEHNINTLLAELVPLLQSSAGSRLRVRSYLGAPPLPVKVDPSGLSNAVLNLVINARDALQAQDQAGVVTISTRLLSPQDCQAIEGLGPGHHVEIEVRDNGTGMPPAVLNRAFEPLFTTKADGKGNGLGLLMVKNFAQKMGGKVALESSPGQGTTARLWLPAAQASLAQQQEAENRRLQALHALNVLDTPASTELERLVQQAAQVCGVPIALLTLVDTDRQWFKVSLGLAQSQTPRAMAFCDHAVQQNSSLVVPDASHDQRFSGNPLVLDDPHIRFYGGALVRDAQGYPLGTLCVIDQHRRMLSRVQIDELERLAQAASALLQGGTASQATSGLTEQSAPLTKPPSVRSGSSRILVVDDEPDLRRLAHDWLAEMGHQVSSCETYAEATQALSSQAFDVLFTDVLLPSQQDGVSLARMAMTQDPQLRVLLTSGFTGSNASADTLPAPLLPKPYRKKELQQAIQQLLDRP